MPDNDVAARGSAPPSTAAYVKGRCVVRRSHRYTYRAECSCGWRGPNQMIREDAVTDRDGHTEHRGMVAGGWMQQQQWGPIHGVTLADGRLVVFDPPNALWPAGGQRVRMEDFDTERPILAVEAFSGEVYRHGMRVTEAVGIRG